MLDNLIQKIKTQSQFAPALNAKVRFDVEGQGSILYDGHKQPADVTAVDENTEADTVFALSADNLQKLMDGTLDPTMAYMMGKVKIKGKMGIAMKMASYLGD